MSGFVYQSTCYATAPQAQDAFFSGQTPQFFLSTDSTTIFSYKLVSGAWVFQKSIIDSTGHELIQYQVQPETPIFPACENINDPVSSFFTGLELGGAVAATMVLAWCVRAIRPYR